VQAARLFQHLRTTDRTAEHARHAIQIADREGFPYHRAIGGTLLGWAEVMNGEASGLDRLRLGVQRQVALGAEMERPYSLGLLAEALAHLGDDAAALAAISEALALPEIRQRSFFWEAELHRLRGLILLHQGSVEGAEACVRRALDIAARQGARSLELRAAVGLYRLHRDTGLAPDAPGRLQGLIGCFPQEVETPDLREARAVVYPERAPAT